jgi:hypothetical protein
MTNVCFACWQSCDEPLEPLSYRRLPAEQRAISAPDRIACPHCLDTDNLYILDECVDELLSAAKHDEDHRRQAIDLIAALLESQQIELARQEQTITRLRNSLDQAAREWFERGRRDYQRGSAA